MYDQVINHVLCKKKKIMPFKNSVSLFPPCLFIVFREECYWNFQVQLLLYLLPCAVLSWFYFKFTVCSAYVHDCYLLKLLLLLL